MRWTYGEPKRMRGLFSFSFNSVRVNMESYEVRGNFFPVNCDSEKDPVLTTVKTEEEAQKEIDFYVNLGIPRKELYFQKSVDKRKTEPIIIIGSVFNSIRSTCNGTFSVYP
jgi:hypothetical protein